MATPNLHVDDELQALLKLAAFLESLPAPPQADVSSSTALIQFPAAQACKKFTLFRLLPLEIRVKIFKLALPEKGRLIQIRFFEDEKKFDYRFVCDVPPLLHVCREFRFEAEKVYKIALGEGRDAQNKAYIDFEKDKLYISQYQFTPKLDNFFLNEPVASFAKIKHVIMDRMAFFGFFDAEDESGIVEVHAALFKDLETLTIAHLGDSEENISTCAGGCTYNVPCFVTPEECVIIHHHESGASFNFPQDWSSLYDTAAAENENSPAAHLADWGSYIQGCKDDEDGYQWEKEIIEHRKKELKSWSEVVQERDILDSTFQLPEVSIKYTCERSIPVAKKFLRLALPALHEEA